MRQQAIQIKVDELCPNQEFFMHFLEVIYINRMAIVRAGLQILLPEGLFS